MKEGVYRNGRLSPSQRAKIKSIDIYNPFYHHLKNGLLRKVIKKIKKILKIK